MSVVEATAIVTAELPELLTWDEIRARYPDEWVFLAEVDYFHPNGPEIRTARVISHGKTLGAPVEQAFRWRDHHDLIDLYYTYTGPTPGRIFSPRPRLILDEETRDLLRYWR